MRQSGPSPLLPVLLAIAAVMPMRQATSQTPERPLPAVAYLRLDSLEHAALTGTTFASRLHAVGTINSIAIGQGNCAFGPAPSAIEFPGLVSRLASIYRRSKDTRLRSAIVAKMIWQAECAEAVAFLVEAAEGAPLARPTRGGIVIDESRASPQALAVSILASFGTLGEPALRRMHSEGRVRDSTARTSLDILSRTGFRRSAAVVPAHEATAQERPPRPFPADAYRRLDSLEHAALTGATFRSRQHAVSTITSIGIGKGDCVRGPVPPTIKYPGLVSSLASIYRRSEDAELRRSILGLMVFQVECDEAVAFLTEVAEEPPPPPKPSAGYFVTDGFRNTLQSDAVSLLVSFGALGEPALRHLHREGTVLDSVARELLETLARNGFKRPK